MFFSWLHWSCVFWEEGHRTVLFVASHESTCINMTCPCWCWPWSSAWGSIFQVLTIDYSFLLFPYCTLWKEVTINSLHIRNRELCSISLRAEYFHKLFGVLLLGRLSTFALWLCQSLWLCGSQQTVENSSRDENTRPPYLPPEKPVCKSRSDRTGYGTTEWFQIGKRARQGCILSPWLFNLYAEYIMRNAGLDEAQAGIMIAKRNTNNLRNADDTNCMAKSKEELKSLLMKVQEESKKAGLKFNIQKMKIMTTGPITSWKIDGEMMETVKDYFIGLQNHCR